VKVTHIFILSVCHILIVLLQMNFISRLRNVLRMRVCHNNGCFLYMLYGISSVKLHQAATSDCGCSIGVLFLGGSFSMVNFLGGGDCFANRER